MTNFFDWWPNSALTFAHPWLLLLLLAIPLLAWLRGKRGPAAALTYSSTASLRAIGKQSAARAGKILRTLILASLAIFVIALARPQLGKSLTQIEASGIDIMLVLDVSGSMLTKDFTIGGQEAARVDVIRDVTRKFIEARPNDRIGIIAFAGGVVHSNRIDIWSVLTEVGAHPFDCFGQAIFQCHGWPPLENSLSISVVSEKAVDFAVFRALARFFALERHFNTSQFCD